MSGAGWLTPVHRNREGRGRSGSRIQIVGPGMVQGVAGKGRFPRQRQDRYITDKANDSEFFKP